MRERSSQWNKGYYAFFDGTGKDDNPYVDEDSQEFQDWDDGWIAGQADTDSETDDDPEWDF